MDIIQVLTQQTDFQAARKYWNKLKERLGQESPNAPAWSLKPKPARKW
ncbi:MAG: hypothetical protein WCH61_00925 [bacterium]